MCVFLLLLAGVTWAQVVLFSDDFSSNIGWSLDSEWAIAATASNSCGHACTGGTDPAFDHSPSADNQVLGVVPGGCAGTNIHGFYFATSPVINTAGFPIEINYWRHLHVDYAPFMQSVIDVFDGATWVRVFATGDFDCVNDAAWFNHIIDVSAHANALFRVCGVDRLCLLVETSGWVGLGSFWVQYRSKRCLHYA